MALASSMVAFGQGEDRAFEPQRGVLWTPYQSWTVDMLEHAANPFDVVATVTFTHEGTRERRQTEMFHAGNERWSFRFTGTRTGRWTFETISQHEALHGWHGEVTVEPNPDPHATGFLTTHGTRFAAPSDEVGGLVARRLNVYMDHAALNSLHDLPSDPAPLAARVDVVLDDVEAHGFDAVFVAMNNNWFAFGADSYADHDSENPSLTSFFVLETLILRAHARGLGVHVWAWGDEERRWTPIGVGGINGVPDRRLQRYLAARLGPLPGWTMSYGFDLNEWVTPAEVRSWWSFLKAHLGWPHLLMAREARAERQDATPTFVLGSAKLDVFSSDERPHEDFLVTAAALIEASDVPVLFERRFLHTRDGVWDMDTTRRALWQFTLAGGAAAVWGVLWVDGPPYPDSHQLRTYRDFWFRRWTLDLATPAVWDTDANVYVVLDTGGTRAVIYAEAASSVPLNRSGLSGPHAAVAVDTRLPYAEIDLGSLDPRGQAWTAPYESDWAIALGTF